MLNELEIGKVYKNIHSVMLYKIISSPDKKVWMNTGKYFTVIEHPTDNSHILMFDNQLFVFLFHVNIIQYDKDQMSDYWELVC